MSELLCSKCKHCIPDDTSWRFIYGYEASEPRDRWRLATCKLNAHRTMALGLEFVDGREIAKQYNLCRAERAARKEGHCGAEGRFWEPFDPIKGEGK